MTEHFIVPSLPTTRAVTLTPRQADVLHGMCLGLSNRQIGRRLDLAEDTVKSHCKALFRALGADSRTHAVALAHCRGRIPIREPQGEFTEWLRAS